MSEEPERPTGVRIAHPDGTETPLELAYDGTDGDGIHVWVADHGLAPEDKVRIEKLPARTSIAFRDLP